MCYCLSVLALVVMECGFCMNVAVICEFSGIVRDAFVRHGHSAVSFDLLPSLEPGDHRVGDVRKLPFKYWKRFDLAVCHPPCTYLASSGARWWKDREKEQRDALRFVKWLMELPIDKICIENPVGIISTKIRKPDQIIQPWMFGHGEMKRTCLWLQGLPLLEPTNVVDGRENRIANMPDSKGRSLRRSLFYPGIADAMASQWG